MPRDPVLLSFYSQIWSVSRTQHYHALSTVFLTPYAAGLISCGLRALPTKTLLLPDYKLGINRPKFGNILHAGCLLGGFFVPLVLLPFWIFGMTSDKIFQANSEARHGKLEWFIHVKSFWSLLEQLKRFCDLDHKCARCQGKIFCVLISAVNSQTWLNY